jgi:hypothetical protein
MSLTKEPTGGNCLICNKPVPDYIEEMCCDGYQCGCRGMPTYPCICSDECDDALMKYIGMPFEERRIKAGIALWAEPPKEEA